MSTNLDDQVRDKFRTGDTPLTGRVFYTLTLPRAIWFIAEIADALLTATIPENWEQEGSVSVDDAVEAASEMLESFNVLVGTIFPVTWNTIPSGYLICDGGMYNREDYPLLYNILPAAFKIDADTFMVPNLSGKTIIGTSLSHPIGEIGGEETHTLDESELPTHAHTTHSHGTGLAVTPGELPVSTPGLVPEFTGDVGSGQGHNNMQPYLALTYVIAAG